MRTQPTALLALALTSCVSSKIVALHRGTVSCMPGVSARHVDQLTGNPNWKEDLDSIVAAADACEVVQFDDRIAPIGAGFITYGGFASDMAQKRRDQLLGAPEPGLPLRELCPAPPPEAPPSAPLPSGAGNPIDLEDFYLTNHLEPPYQNAWIPVAREPEQAGAAVGTCTGAGHPSDDAATLCVFARVAMQPDRAAPIILVAHGLFDSSAHRYVRNTGASLFAMGFSVALLDMRDHGNTLRANGLHHTGTTLGPREAQDLIAIAGQVKTTCGATRKVGFVGFSGGGAAGVHAYAADTADVFDLGVLAVSPLIDPEDTIDRMQSADDECFLFRAAEITPRMYGVIGVIAAVTGGLGVFGYEHIDQRSLTPDHHWGAAGLAALMTGVGSLGVTALIDGLGDGRPGLGDHGACLSISPIANLYKDLVAERGRSLGLGDVSLATYPVLRSGIELHTLHDLAIALPAKVRAAQAIKAGRLAIVAAQDDPVVDWPKVARFADSSSKNVGVFPLAHGGHTSFAALSPVYARELLHHFFCSAAWTCTPPP